MTLGGEYISLTCVCISRSDIRLFISCTPSLHLLPHHCLVTPRSHFATLCAIYGSAVNSYNSPSRAASTISLGGETDMLSGSSLVSTAFSGIITSSGRISDGSIVSPSIFSTALTMRGSATAASAVAILALHSSEWLAVAPFRDAMHPAQPMVYPWSFRSFLRILNRLDTNSLVSPTCTSLGCSTLTPTRDLMS